ncbi:MAG: adenine deaminase [Spirochaetales bacterium]|nr:adenine deaminase [Candidatus Physcosoma equi]
MNKQLAKALISASMGREACDLVIQNAKVVDVYNQEVFSSDVYLKDGFIAGFGGDRTAKETLDAEGQYLVPGFIDAHCHIESSHLSPSEFSNAVVPCGTTTVIADPHEICNVRGLDAMRYMLSSAENAVLGIYYMFPSCVPATPFEHSGAVLNAADIENLIDHDRILGRGELMHYPGVVNGEEFILDKLETCYRRKKLIDGHVPSITGQGLDAYISGGVLTDHECETPEELQEKVRIGMYVLLRQGTVCKNVLGLLPGVTEKNYRRCLFCTDDRQPQSITREGHINHGVNLAIQNGLDPLMAITMASLNASECYGLRDRGAIAPGKKADFFLCKTLDDLQPTKVFISGSLVAEDGKIQKVSPHIAPFGVDHSVQLDKLSKSYFSLPLTSERARVIQILPGGVVTEKAEAAVKRDKNGEWIHDPEVDILKVTVIERRHKTGSHASALLSGYGMKHGAIASTIAHDSHNLIVVGDNDDDMLTAAEEIKRIGGGITIVKDGIVLASHPLEIAGLMTDLPVEEVVECLDELHRVTETELEGINPNIDPFMTLCFMALPVIPAYKVTDCGLFDVTTFSFVDVSIESKEMKG